MILASHISHNYSAFHIVMERDPGTLPKDPKDACLSSESMDSILWLGSVKELTR